MTEGIDRRTLLTGMGAGATLALASSAQGAEKVAAPAIQKGLPDIAVIGAGAFGGWAALSLRERGAKVTLVDLYGPGNPRASSGDESRLIRAGYFREIYSRMALRAWDLWHQRQEEFGRHLIFPNGSLHPISEEQAKTQRAVFDKLNVPYEMLKPEEAAYRWPQLGFSDISLLILEKKAGVVKARESMIAVSEAFQKKGGTLRTGFAELGTSSSGRLDTILVDKQPVPAGAYVFACGPWLPKVMPQVMGNRILVPRREMYYIGSPPQDRRYRWEHCPNFSDSFTYTAADIDYGVKVAASLPNTLMDPDSGDRMPSPFLAEQVKQFVARRLPGLKDQPVVAARVCQTEYSDNNDYIIDRHPEFANVMIAGGGSGHGFKMGPALGEYISDRMLGAATDPEKDALFALSAHGPVDPNNMGD
jgi:sarcosine oxidase